MAGLRSYSGGPWKLIRRAYCRVIVARIAHRYHCSLLLALRVNAVQPDGELADSSNVEVGAGLYRREGVFSARRS
ncbi:hypothetical protein AOQ84DRAFT_167744 [Glonium stellatum]|uniref:Uncharacterized protein n=1 Tax=Glonium stellatum TaxID=574774 RepID=A0A8E2F7R7_9PEZI|nr:hypothetical protein AOQ84DRAFT_167744 [Glonium stellatum]